MQIDSLKQTRTHRTTTRRLAAVAALAAMTVGGAAACASTTASAKPSSTTAGGSTGVPPSTPVSVTPSGPSPSATPSIQPGGTMIPAPGSSGGQTFKATGYTSNGDDLTVDFYAGLCDKYGLRLDQSSTGRVLVTVVATQLPRTGARCPMLIKQQQVTADMGSPLDGRAVVDSTTGSSLPQLDTPSGTKYYSPGPVKAGG